MSKMKFLYKKTVWFFEISYTILDVAQIGPLHNIAIIGPISRKSSYFNASYYYFIVKTITSVRIYTCVCN